ncbi:helix-turn-helix domain-containing protein [Nisaea denitrificans]|uniref:helix-turn-helix domain-containing protein n=1 Tax=Nisaea denitrificans TaxID=390877 RepID=UPI000403316F|nr:helix-turn-helix transcriptional regulator [Nisaea denitrificans]
MSTIQIITSPSGEQMVVLSKEEFDLMAANQFDEDAETLRIYRESMAAIERGDDIALPEATWDRLEERESPVRVLREFRSMTQKELAETAGISQSYLSEIERGTREGTLSTIKALAKALAVPLTVLTEDY